jgi:uncharacterized membrane protein
MAIFWSLALAHLLGDFALQTGRLIRAKRRLPGLLIHGAIHLVVAGLLLASTSLIAWIALVGLVFVHLLVDWVKISNERSLDRSPPLYFILDQYAHIILIILAAALINAVEPVGPTLLSPDVVFVLIGLVLAGFTWSICEQVLVDWAGDGVYRRELDQYRAGRIIGRCALFLAAWGALQAWPTARAAAYMPYLSGRYRVRALVTDVIVSFAMAALVRLVA